MSVSAETYIVISLMFAVFAAVAAVGTSVVLGAGFERLRAGFDVIRRQSGFFADAIHKLDQRTQKLDEEQARMKGQVYHLGERVERADKQVTFAVEAIGALEQRILEGSPAQAAPRPGVTMRATMPSAAPQAAPQPIRIASGFVAVPKPDLPQRRGEVVPEFETLPKLRPEEERIMPISLECGQEEPSGLTTLLSQYFTGEQSGGGRGVIYH